MNHIELFAGCGGLSLGLETAGFDLLFANELSPMASESFAFNHLNVDLSKEPNPSKVFWISSQYDRSLISKRLRENPYEATGLKDDQISDLTEINPSNEQLFRSLLVGSIVDLNTLLTSDNNKLLGQFQSALGQGEVDLISGGPPCQSFSLAGLRDHTHHRNQLPWEFAKFVGSVRPKMALLENVSGILRAFKIDDQQYYAWFEVAKAFAQLAYVPICLHVNAKYVGVAQNRPRFIMLAIRRDVAEKISANLDCGFSPVLEKSLSFTTQVIHGVDVNYGSLSCYDIEKDSEIFRDTVLSPLYSQSKSNFTSVRDALDDLRDGVETESEYVELINTVLLNTHNKQKDKQKNHDLRANTPKVKARFRLYQILSKMPKQISKEVATYLKTKGESEIEKASLSEIKKHWILDLNGNVIEKPTDEELLNILYGLHTKKQTQKALIGDSPAPAALSIPDDACHYFEDLESQRTLTVREMARIQSFPDWFEVRSKVTTGGQMRKFEVPQYTQMGNAVPPLLGLALGKVCKNLLERC